MLLERLVKATVELQGFRVVTVTGDAGGLVAELAPDRRFVPRCGQCGTRGAYRDTRPVRRFRHVPLWGIPVALRYAPRRVGCPRCAGVHVESMPWVRGKQQMTHALLVTLATWARALPWEQVARLFRCSWGTVATAVEEAVAVGLAHRDLDHLTHIGIDEISRKRGHVYVTNVYDLARKRLVWSGEGRTTDTLNAFFDFLGPEKTAALAGICCDMWHPYIDVIKDRAGQAVLVFDKFHIVSHLMKAVDQVRRDEIREKGPAHKALMHKTRFIWLKNPWNLTEAQHRRLSELEHLNLKINRAYLLKERPRRHLLRYVAPVHRRHQGPSRPGGAGVRQVPHRESSHEGGRPGPPRRDPREGTGAQGADAQDALHLAEESLESHRSATPPPERARTPQPEDQPRLSAQGALRAFLDLPPRRLGQAVPEALVLVGHAFTPATAERLRLDAAPPREGHPQLLPHAHRQRYR